MVLNANEERLLATLAEDLRREFGAIDVRLFGSAARGALDDESDVDIFVVVPMLDWQREQDICNRCYETTLACGRLISASVFSADELRNTPLKVSPFVEAVFREGQRL